MFGPPETFGGRGMDARHTDDRHVEAFCRSMLHTAAARRQAAATVEPEAPSVDYRTGFAAGREAGEMATLALAVSALTGESPTGWSPRRRSTAVFPVELHAVGSDDAPPTLFRERHQRSMMGPTIRSCPARPAGCSPTWGLLRRTRPSFTPAVPAP